jgi:hypothetical protein
MIRDKSDSIPDGFRATSTAANHFAAAGFLSSETDI